MELIAEERRTDAPAVLAFGAYRHGGHLRCGLLLVQAGQRETAVTLSTQDGTTQIRARLPQDALGHAGHARFSRIELEIL